MVREDRAMAAKLRCDTLNSTKDDILIVDEDHVTVLTHHLRDQRQARWMPPESQAYDAVVSRLGNLVHAGAFEVLAQQHDKRARLVERLGHAPLGQGHAGVLWMRREQQPVIGAS